jgi:predicted PurR-regulated permease PerM
MGQRRFQGGDNTRGERERRDRHDHSPRTEFALRAVIVVALFCAGAVTLWLGYKGISVWLAIFAGILLAVLLRTAAEPLVRYARFPLWAAVLTVLLVGAGILTLTGWQMAPAVSRQFDEMSVRLPEAIDRVRGQLLSYRWTEWLLQKGESATEGRKVLQQISHAFQLTFTAVGALVIVMFLSIYMAAQPNLYVQGIIRLVPVHSRARARVVCSELYRMLRVWLLTKLFTMVLTGTGIAIGLWLLKVPLALALGVLAGVLEFIPTLGPLLSCAPAILIALMVSPFKALQVAAVYFVVQWLGNHVTTPLIQQRTLAIPPAVTLALVALLGTLFGFGGLLLSGPLTVVVFVLIKMLYVEDLLEGRRSPRGPRTEHARAAARHSSNPGNATT